MGTMYKPQNNGPHTELSATINAGQTSITVTNASVLPAAPNVLTIGAEEDAELVLVENITGNILTAQRGFNGTTAKSWSSGTWIYRAITAQDIEELQKRAGKAVYSVDGMEPDSTGNVDVGAVRYGAAQELTDEQKTQALANLGIREVVRIKKLCDAVNVAVGATVTFDDAPANYDCFIARINYRGAVGMTQGTGNTATISLSSFSGGSSSFALNAIRLQGDMTGTSFAVYQGFTATIKSSSAEFAVPDTINIGPIYGVKAGGA